LTKLAKTKIINKHSEKEKKWERNSDVHRGRGRQMEKCTHEEMTPGGRVQRVNGNKCERVLEHTIWLGDETKNVVTLPGSHCEDGHILTS
jgi:hypothetical protein